MSNFFKAAYGAKCCENNNGDSAKLHYMQGDIFNGNNL